MARRNDNETAPDSRTHPTGMRAARMDRIPLRLRRTVLRGEQAAGRCPNPEWDVHRTVMLERAGSVARTPGVHAISSVLCGAWRLVSEGSRSQYYISPTLHALRTPRRNVAMYVSPSRVIVGQLPAAPADSAMPLSVSFL